MILPAQRSTEITGNQRGETRPELQHQQFAQRLSKEADLAEQTVQESPQSEDAEIRKDGRGNSGYSGGNRKKKGKKEPEKKPQARASDSMFDLSV